LVRHFHDGYSGQFQQLRLHAERRWLLSLSSQGGCGLDLRAVVSILKSSETMKRIHFLLPLLFCGCSSTNITKLTAALAKDPAIVSSRVTTLYGTVSFVRVGGGWTNSVSVSPDGTVTVK
jgi:hypothetical protein